MAKILVKIEKEDILTSKLGDDFMISCDNNIDLIFSREALEELINDYKTFKNYLEDVNDNNDIFSDLCSEEI